MNNDGVLAFLVDAPTIKSRSDLQEMLRTMKELGEWPDEIDSVSADQAILLWRIVETLRHKRLPKSLKV